ncbi:hypothetical protein AABD40_08990 [Staphylococcus shinii]
MRRKERTKKEHREDVEYYLKIATFSILLIEFLRKMFQGKTPKGVPYLLL